MEENKVQQYVTLNSVIDAIDEQSHTKFDWSEELDADDLKKVINQLPKVTVSCIHASWEYPDWAPDGGSYVMKRCTNCKYTPDKYNYTQYCPDCGAYMTNGKKVNS